MIRLAACLACLGLISACAPVPVDRLAPLPPLEARAFRTMATHTSPVVVLIAVANTDEASTLPRSDLLVAVNTAPVPVGQESWMPLQAHKAILLRPPSATILVRARPRDAAMPRELPATAWQVDTSGPIFLGLEEILPVPPDGPRVRVTRLAETDARRLLASRTLVTQAAPQAGTSSTGFRAVANADSTRAVATGAIPPGRGRLLVLAGDYVDERRGVDRVTRALDARFGAAIRTRSWGDVVIDGVRMATIERDEALALDLLPGSYAVHWEHRDPVTGAPGIWSYEIELPREVVIRAEETAVLRADMIDRTIYTPNPGRTLLGFALAGRIYPEGEWDFAQYMVLRPSQQAAADLLAGGRRIVVPPPEAIATLPGASSPAE